MFYKQYFNFYFSTRDTIFEQGEITPLSSKKSSSEKNSQKLEDKNKPMAIMFNSDDSDSSGDDNSDFSSSDDEVLCKWEKKIAESPYLKPTTPTTPVLAQRGKSTPSPSPSMFARIFAPSSAKAKQMLQEPKSQPVSFITNFKFNSDSDSESSSSEENMEEIQTLPSIKPLHIMKEQKSPSSPFELLNSSKITPDKLQNQNNSKKTPSPLNIPKNTTSITPPTNIKPNISKSPSPASSSSSLRTNVTNATPSPSINNKIVSKQEAKAQEKNLSIMFSDSDSNSDAEMEFNSEDNENNIEPSINNFNDHYDDNSLDENEEMQFIIEESIKQNQIINNNATTTNHANDDLFITSPQIQKINSPQKSNTIEIETNDELMISRSLIISPPSSPIMEQEEINISKKSKPATQNLISPVQIENSTTILIDSPPSSPLFNNNNSNLSIEEFNKSQLAKINYTSNSNSSPRSSKQKVTPIAQTSIIDLLKGTKKSPSSNSTSEGSIKPGKPLEKLTEQLEKEAATLSQKAKQQTFQINSVTSTMITDTQKLLTLFGIPYVISPSEAEAQCAELLQLGLVDAIATEDSDVLLFGGDNIIKNLFTQNKDVEEFLFENIKNELGLSRDMLIDYAQLVGSDYTDGIKGIGPIFALEILGEFSSVENFAKWFRENNDISSKNHNKFQKKVLRLKKKGKLILPDSFPDKRVYNAYVNPNVSHSKEEFSWSTPDFDALRDFMCHKVNWSLDKTNELILPIIKVMEDISTYPVINQEKIKLNPKLKSTRAINAFANLKIEKSSNNNENNKKRKKDLKTPPKKRPKFS